MTAALKTVADTSSLCRFVGALGLFTLPPPSTGPRWLEDKWQQCPVRLDYELTGSTASPAIEISDASTDVVSAKLHMAAVAARVEALLAQDGYAVSRKGKTADDSILLQYLDGRKSCVDVYPNGDLVVMNRIGIRREIHALTWADLDRVPALVKDAGAGN